MAINVIGVVGAGQMGAGIAQVAAQAGVEAILVDVDLSRAEAGRKGIEKRLARNVEKGKMTAAERDAVLGRVRAADAIAALASADFVVEAVSEDEKLKARILTGLDETCRPDVILATNTSSIPITRLGALTKRPDRVIGMHFMNPVPVMELVEVIRGLATSDETHRATVELAGRMGKKTVVARDMPGFIVNRVLMPMINEAVVALYEGIGSVEDIDVAMKLGTNQPMGPLTLADFIGLDTCLAIMEVLHHGTGDTKYRPCPLLRQYVEAGWLGRKTGRGFYKYEG
jgi:3-hydroxybutyryl-CoA dehydrogenase